MQDEQAAHAGDDNHEHGQAVGGVDEEVDGQHQAQRRPDPHHDDHDVHGDAHEAGVVDVEVLDVAALVGQEEPEDDQEALVDVESTDQVAKVVALALLEDEDLVLCVVLWLSKRRIYSGTHLNGHPRNKDTYVIRTLCCVPNMRSLY